VLLTPPPPPLQDAVEIQYRTDTRTAPRVERPTEWTRLDFGVVRRALILSRSFFLGPRCWRAWTYLGFLILLTAWTAFFTTQSLYYQRTQTNALVAYNGPTFWQAFLLSQLLGLVASGAFWLASPYHEMFLLWWRTSLTDDILNKYLSRNNYLRINTMRDIDNPDQRISDDIKVMLDKIYFMVTWGLQTISQLVVLVPLVYREAGIQVLGIIVLACSVSLAYPKLFAFFVRYDNLQYRAEADFRFGLVRLRENAEAIAFFRGEQAERRELATRFGKIIAVTKFLITRQLLQNIVTGLYYMGIGLIPTLLLAPRYFHHELDLGALNNITTIVGRVEFQLSLGVIFFNYYLNMAVSVNRLWNLVEGINKPKETPPNERIKVVDSNFITLADVTVVTPDAKRTLIEGLSFSVNEGDAMLVTGPNGSGKSSLLRVIAGLWDRGGGVVGRPPRAEMAFLPQRPYMALGDLRAQLIYPRQDLAIDDDELARLLQEVRLGHVVEAHGMRTPRDWATLLSMGEQQRIAFARLFITRPRFAILDEATSAMDIEMETELYGRLRETGTGLVSVGHRPTLLPFHDAVLALSGDGGWRIIPRTELRPSADGAAVIVKSDDESI
jgi:putative ATP-binding cassette transporter